MTYDYIGEYESNKTNAQIAATASEFFFSTNDDRNYLLKYQSSFNYLEIVNNSDEDIIVYFDGLATKYRRLFGKSIIVIKPEENIYFNTLKITNTSGANAITAGDLIIIARIMKPYATPVTIVR